MMSVTLANQTREIVKGVYLQAGFVEGKVQNSRTFDDMKTAFAHIFWRCRENAILLCGGIPVCISYHSDLPVLLPNLLHCLDALQQQSMLRNYRFEIKTENIEARWVFDVENDVVLIRMDWVWVKGDYQASLNVFEVFRQSKQEFISEWLILLKQCQQSLMEAGVHLIGQGQVDLELLNTVESRITSFGFLYRQLNEVRVVERK